MCRFVETIRVENGQALYLDLHESRMNATRRQFWPELSPVSLAVELGKYPLENFKQRTRCRILYDMHVVSVEFGTYTPRRVSTLRCMEANELEYSFKYENRSDIDALYARRGRFDEVLIVRNGLLTDTTIANIALWNGVQWHTPAAPLLKGTHRERLLDNGVLVPRAISIREVSNYSKICLFNAMLDFGETIVGTNNIYL